MSCLHLSHSFQYCAYRARGIIPIDLLATEVVERNLLRWTKRAARRIGEEGQRGWYIATKGRCTHHIILNLTTWTSRCNELSRTRQILSDGCNRSYLYKICACYSAEYPIYLGVDGNAEHYQFHCSFFLQEKELSFSLGRGSWESEAIRQTVLASMECWGRANREDRGETEGGNITRP